MLQKTMVVVEGVARKLDPQLNMWSTSEPVVGAWIAENLGPRGLLEDAGRDLASAVAFLSQRGAGGGHGRSTGNRGCGQGGESSSKVTSPTRPGPTLSPDLFSRW